LSWEEKFLERLFRKSIPRDISYREADRFLRKIGCDGPFNNGSSHHKYSYEGYPLSIVLMKNENLRKYQVEDIKNLVLHLDIVEEEGEKNEN